MSETQGNLYGEQLNFLVAHHSRGGHVDHIKVLGKLDRSMEDVRLGNLHRIPWQRLFDAAATLPDKSTAVALLQAYVSPTTDGVLRSMESLCVRLISASFERIVEMTPPSPGTPTALTVHLTSTPVPENLAAPQDIRQEHID